MRTTLRHASPSPAPAPTARPLRPSESGQRLPHQLRLVDESAPIHRAQTAGVLATEVWVKLAHAHQLAPTNPAAMVFLIMTTKPTFRAKLKPGAGETIWEPPFRGPAGSPIAGKDGRGRCSRWRRSQRKDAKTWMPIRCSVGLCRWGQRGSLNRLSGAALYASSMRILRLSPNLSLAVSRSARLQGSKAPRLRGSEASRLRRSHVHQEVLG